MRRLTCVVCLLFLAGCIIDTVPLPEETGGLGDLPRGDTAPSGGGADPGPTSNGGDSSDGLGDGVGGAGDTLPEGDSAPSGDGDAAGDDSAAPPTIAGIDGNGSAHAVAGLAPHHFADALLIYGTNLATASVELRPSGGGGSVALTIRLAQPGLLEVLLPPSVAAGQYDLIVSNAAGSDLAVIALQQGDPGAACPN